MRKHIILILGEEQLDPVFRDFRVAFSGRTPDCVLFLFDHLLQLGADAFRDRRDRGKALVFLKCVLKQVQLLFQRLVRCFGREIKGDLDLRHGFGLCLRNRRFLCSLFFRPGFFRGLGNGFFRGYGFCLFGFRLCLFRSDFLFRYRFLFFCFFFGGFLLSKLHDRGPEFQVFVLARTRFPLRFLFLTDLLSCQCIHLREHVQLLGPFGILLLLFLLLFRLSSVCRFIYHDRKLQFLLLFFRSFLRFLFLLFLFCIYGGRLGCRFLFLFRFRRRSFLFSLFLRLCFFRSFLCLFRRFFRCRFRRCPGFFRFSFCLFVFLDDLDLGHRYHNRILVRFGGSLFLVGNLDLDDLLFRFCDFFRLLFFRRFRHRFRRLFFRLFFGRLLRHDIRFGNVRLCDRFFCDSFNNRFFRRGDHLFFRLLLYRGRRLRFFLFRRRNRLFHHLNGRRNRQSVSFCFLLIFFLSRTVSVVCKIIETVRHNSRRFLLHSYLLRKFLRLLDPDCRSFIRKAFDIRRQDKSARFSYGFLFPRFRLLDDLDADLIVRVKNVLIRQDLLRGLFFLCPLFFFVFLRIDPYPVRRLFGSVLFGHFVRLSEILCLFGRDIVHDILLDLFRGSRKLHFLRNGSGDLLDLLFFFLLADMLSVKREYLGAVGFLRLDEGVFQFFIKLQIKGVIQFVIIRKFRRRKILFLPGLSVVQHVIIREVHHHLQIRRIGRIHGHSRFGLKGDDRAAVRFHGRRELSLRVAVHILQVLCKLLKTVNRTCDERLQFIPVVVLDLRPCIQRIRGGSRVKLRLQIVKQSILFLALWIITEPDDMVRFLQRRHEGDPAGKRKHIKLIGAHQVSVDRPDKADIDTGVLSADRNRLNNELFVRPLDNYVFLHLFFTPVFVFASAIYIKVEK